MHPPRLKFTRRQRLTGRSAFKPIFDHGIRKPAGPLTVLGVPNSLSFHRLGLSVGKRVGNSVQRHRHKRLLREAFRISQHDLLASCDGRGYDLVLLVRPHDELPLDRYRELLTAAVGGVHRQWRKRVRHDATDPA